MIFFKACPKCGGDLYLNKDMYGDYFACIQCGYIKDEVKQNSPTPVAGADSAEPAKTA